VIRDPETAREDWGCGMLAVAAWTVGRDIDSQIMMLVWLCVAVLAGVTMTMVYFLFRFRRSKAKVTRQIEKNTPLEIVWTVVPTIIFVGMFFVGYKGFIIVRDPPKDAMEVEVLAQQWFWTFTYPETGVSASELWLPVNTPVKFKITSVLNDVVHSFFIPAFRIKEDAVPGMDTFLWVNPDEEGVYNIFCAEFCGKDHARMLSRMYVVSRQEFDRWMDRQIAEKYRPIEASDALDPESPELADQDAGELYSRYCSACHGVDGTGGGSYNARDFTKATGWKRSPKLTDSFATVSAGLEGTQMRSFRYLSVRERFALVHHAAAFLKEGTRPPVTDDDIAALKKKFPETDPATFKSAPATRPTIPIEKAMEKVVEEEGRH
jgi:cytochrome c oxidase subunit 2